MKTTLFFMALAIAVFGLTGVYAADKPSRLANNLRIGQYSVGTKTFNNEAEYIIKLNGGEGPQTVTIVGRLQPFERKSVVIVPEGIAIASTPVQGTGRRGKYYEKTYRFPGPGQYKVKLPLKKNWESYFYFTNITDDGQKGKNEIGPVRIVWDGKLNPNRISQR